MSAHDDDGACPNCGFVLHDDYVEESNAPVKVWCEACGWRPLTRREWESAARSAALEERNL